MQTSPVLEGVAIIKGPITYATRRLSAHTATLAMQWEWRVFFAASDPKTSSEAQDSPNKTELPDIWRLLHARPSSSFAAEVRTNVYVSCTPRSGVKFRAGRSLEVKLRCELHDSGADRWEKVCRHAAV